MRAIALGNSVEAISYQEYNSPYEANSWFYTDLLRRNIGATRHLRSLTYIHLYHCNVNFVVLSTLASVSTLRTLDLECCKSHHDANGFVGTLSTTAWTSLRVVNGTSHLYGLSNVLAYMIDRSNLRFLAIDAASEKLVKDLFLAPGGYDSKLETLDVILSAGSSRERFISRLRQERCLTTLTIAAATDTRHWAAPLCFTFKMSLWRSGHKQPVGCTLTLENDWGPWGMADMQAILGAWSPAIPGDLAAHISFTYVPRRSEDVDVVVRDMPLAVVGAMLCLFARRKVRSIINDEDHLLTTCLQAHGNAKVTSILSTSDTLELDIHSADQALLDMVNERLELRRLLDNSLDDTFPSLDCIKVNGERRWRRQTGAGRWQRSTAV